MTKNTLSMRGAFSIIMLIQISNSLFLGYPETGGPETWISLLICTVIITPVMVLYARLVHLMPGKDLYEMMEFAFGKWGKCILAAFYAFYFLNLAAIVRGNYAEFIHLTSLYQTPFIIICLVFFAVCVYIACKGVRVLGLWCSTILVFAVGSILLLTLLSTSDMNFNHLVPLNQEGLGGLIENAFRFVPLPMAESVMVLSIVGNLQKRVNPYKMFLFSTLSSIAFFILLFLQNCSVLSWDTLITMYFPSYKAASVIQVGSIGTRIESLMAFMFILAGISKITLSLIAGTKAVQHLFFLKNYEPLLLPVGFFTVALSVIAFENIMQMFDFISYYVIYAVPFQILIPVALWVTAEIKIRKRSIPIVAGWKKENAGLASQDPLSAQSTS